MKKEVDAVLTPGMRRIRESLESHRVFDEIVDIDNLRRFMQVHVYAVWDFMSLAKRLQRDLTCVELPWMPPADPVAARLINDIVLAEESDIDADGHPASHLDLYLTAMRDVGADTTEFVRFLDGLRAGLSLDEAFEAAGTPQFVREFVGHTLNTALNGSLLETMACFFYGRENVIPDMFQGLLDRWGLNEDIAPGFVYYLKRHIELDGDTHGPAASRLVQSQLDKRPNGLEEAREAARLALSARRALWDGAAHSLRERHARDAKQIASAPGKRAQAVA
ncbi:MAG: DUF3050 domain-containing protein [Xanthomonadaceae bacterium]|nr:DUF3050 domain-containing protein [Xanthomonadaceae bacterium]MCC7249901.1 DUF3050 domain-containing protein [Lysobacter sp.]